MNVIVPYSSILLVNQYGLGAFDVLVTPLKSRVAQCQRKIDNTTS